MMSSSNNNQSHASFVFGALIGAAMVAVVTTETGRKLKNRAKDKARELHDEMPKPDSTNSMSPYETP